MDNPNPKHQVLSNPITSEAPNEPAPNEAAVGVNKCALSDFKGSVVIHFERKCDFLIVTPAEAQQLAAAITRQTIKAHSGSYPGVISKTETIDNRRMVVVQRFIMMMTKHVKSTPEKIRHLATQMADEACKEFLN